MKFLSFEEWVKLQPDDDNLNVCQFCRFSCPDCNGEGFISCSQCAGTGKDWRSKYNNEVTKSKATIKAWGTMAVQL